MLSTISETVEVQEGGILQLHATELKPHTRVTVVAVIEVASVESLSTPVPQAITASKGILHGRISNAVEYQRKCRDEWESRLARERQA